MSNHEAKKPLPDSFDPEQVRRAIDVLIEPGGVFEIRALGAKIKGGYREGIVSGYFDSPEKALLALNNIVKATGIYITFNSVLPDLLARRCNRLDYADKGALTTDSNIIARRWLLVDCDPCRPAGISSTDAEKEHAAITARAIHDYLSGRGWPEPVLADSGNGWHLDYRIDLPADDGGVVERVLKALAAKFNNEHVKVDVQCFNASRIVKLYGTLACKGDDVPSRPHRMSKIVRVPEPLGVVSREQLESLAAELVPPVTTPARSTTMRTVTGQSFDVDEFLRRHNVAIKGEHTKNAVRVIELEQCPFDPSHGGHGEVAVFVHGDGTLGFKCHHNGCDGKGWREFRQHFEPGCYDAKRTLAESVESVESAGSNSTIPPIPQGVIATDLTLPESYYPTESVIGRFVDYCHAQIETPKLFIVAGVLTLVSVLLHRRVFYQWGGKRIYPNLFQVCVGNSGVVRKSDAICIVREFVHELYPEVLLADFTSHERFVECFAEHPVRAMVYSEGKNLIDLLNCKYGAALAGDMIRLYDCEPISSDFKGDKHKTEDGESSGRIVATNTFLTVLVGVIPEGWRFPDNNQVNGLMGRFELLYADHREHEILDEPPVLGDERERLLGDFRELMKIDGQMRLSEKARKLWLLIQRENRQRLDEASSNQVASNLSRIPFTVLRVAMLYEAAMSGRLEISADAVELAYNYVDFCHRCYLHFAGEMQKGWFAQLQERIIGVLQRLGPRMTYSHLLNRVSTHGECDAKTFKAALENLEDRGLIRRLPSESSAKNPDVELVTK